MPGVVPAQDGSSQNHTSLPIGSPPRMDSPFTAAPVSFSIWGPQHADEAEGSGDVFLTPTSAMMASPFSRASASDAAMENASKSLERRGSGGMSIPSAADALPSVGRASMPADPAALLRRSASVPFAPPPPVKVTLHRRAANGSYSARTTDTPSLS